MRTHYHCGQCKQLLEATEEHFFLSSLTRVEKNPNRLAIPQCKKCGNAYSKKRYGTIKTKGFTRNQKKTLTAAGAVIGTIYVIGPDVPETPYKIGITSGSNTDKRKTSLQTAHWMELKLIWKSKVLDRADKIEKKLHKHFKKKWVRGEWFNITKKDINAIPMLVEQFGLEDE